MYKYNYINIIINKIKFNIFGNMVRISGKIKIFESGFGFDGSEVLLYYRIQTPKYSHRHKKKILLSYNVTLDLKEKTKVSYSAM